VHEVVKVKVLCRRWGEVGVDGVCIAIHITIARRCIADASSFAEIIVCWLA
jgi:hypothetical protein